MTTQPIPSTTDDLIAEIELDFQSARKLGREAYIDMQDGEALIARIRELEDVLGMYSLPLGGDINQDCAEFGGDAVHRELMRRTVLDGSKVAPP
jgi:hypothetical protein